MKSNIIIIIIYNFFNKENNNKNNNFEGKWQQCTVLTNLVTSGVLESDLDVNIVTLILSAAWCLEKTF